MDSSSSLRNSLAKTVTVTLAGIGYAGTTVSAPSRTSLLTGLHTGHAPIRGNKEIAPEGQAPLSQPGNTLSGEND